MQKKRGKNADKNKLNFKEEFIKSIQGFHSFLDPESLFAIVLFLMLGLLFLNLKYSWIGLINWIIEFFSIMILYLICIKLPLKIKNKWAHIIPKILFVILLLIHFFLYLINTIFLGDAIAMKYDLTAININSISFFFIEIFPLNYLIISTIIILISLVIVYYSEVIVKDIILKHFYKIMIFLLIISTLIIVFQTENISNPYINYFVQRQGNDKSNTIIFDKYPTQFTDFSEFDKSNWNFEDIELKDKNVFVIILEQSDLETYFKETEKIKDEYNFFLQHQNNLHLFTNYYTPNQDSRTSIWAMFNSQYIPFEAYISGWNKKYGVILEKNNLIDFFNYKNYSTIIASSVYYPNLILSIYNWTDILHLTSFDAKNKEFICIHNFQNQQGCEDRILLEDINKSIKEHKNKNIFFVQELIYGHGEEYMRRGSKSRVRYYNDYLIDLYEVIKTNEIENDSIILIMSDHGEKGYFNKKISNFKIPLVIIDKELEHREIDSLYSHLNFKDLLFYYMANKEMPTANKEIYFVGQTGCYEYGYLDDQNNYFIGNIDENKNKIKYKLNFNNTIEIENKIKFLIDYQQTMINLSLQKNYVCEFCRQNIDAVESKYK